MSSNMNLKSTLISVSVDTNRRIIELNWINIVNVFVQTDHQYSQPTAEVIPETLSYTGGYGPLDLTTYFIYAAAIIIVTYVRCHFLIPTINNVLMFDFSQLVLIKIVESIYRREKLRCFFRCFFRCRWGRNKRSDTDHTQPDSIQLNCCSTNSNSQVEEEKTLTRSLVREKKLNDYAVIVANLYKAYDDSNVVRGIDFAVKQGSVNFCFFLIYECSNHTFSYFCFFL